jgi:hypothetical protein
MAKKKESGSYLVGTTHFDIFVSLISTASSRSQICVVSQEKYLECS